MEEQPSSAHDFGGLIKGIVGATFTAIFIVWKVNTWFGGKPAGVTTVIWAILAIGLSLVVIFIVFVIVMALVGRILGTPTSTPDSSQATSGENTAPSLKPVAPGVDQWWLMQFGRPTGPHTTTALREAAAVGDFPLDSPICQVGELHWSTLQKLVDTPVVNG